VEQFVAWHEDGTIARDVWAGQGGATYQDAAQEFINGELVFYYSGSWQVGRMDEQVGDFFDWQVVGSPCGPAGACSGMPGGAGIVGFSQTEHPEAVAAVIDFLAQEDIYAEVTARTRNLPGHLGVASAGVEFQDASPGRGRCWPPSPPICLTWHRLPSPTRATRATARCSASPLSV
jgi:alpha-1,4-digalacturonate transport system substrate-binding protein